MPLRQMRTGVPGLNEILSGGYLAACPTLLMGTPGCGKTLFLLQFLAEGAAAGHRAVCATCSEAPDRMAAYVRALGHPVDDWRADGRLIFVDLRSDPNEVLLGPIDQDVVMVRLLAAMEENGAVSPDARLGIDDLNRLAYAFDPAGTARGQTLGLLRLLRESGLTTLITASDDAATRETLIDYAVDAVVELRQTVDVRLMTRTLRVMKMRGVAHGTNEYPFMIDSTGPSLMPATLGEGHHLSRGGMISTGINRLDDLLGGGLHRGSALMVSGTSGTGKTTLVGQIAAGLCAAGQSVTYLALEQDASELVHDYAGVGIDMQPFLDSGALRFRRMRSVDCSLEEHLIRFARTIEADKANVVVVDAITSLADLDRICAVKSMVLRLIDFCKSRGVLVILNELLRDGQGTVSDLNLSSLLDAWIRVELFRQSGEFVRLIRVLKGRGANTSQQIKEFKITQGGICIEDPYIGSGTFVFGSEKLVREDEESREAVALRKQLDRLRREVDVVPQTFEARIQETTLQRDKAVAALRDEIGILERRLEDVARTREAMTTARGGS